jgi:hypothetical protein
VTFTAVGSPVFPTVSGSTFTLVPSAVGDFIMLTVLVGSTNADWATALSSTGGNVTWASVGTPAHIASGVGNTTTTAMFIGKVVTAASHTVTITVNAGSPTLHVGFMEFSNTLGFSAVTVDASGTVDVLSSGHFPAVTPTRSGDLYWSYIFDNGTGLAGSTSGYTYALDPNANPLCFNVNCANSTQTPNIGDTNGTTGIAVMLYESGTGASGALSVTGTASAAAAGAAASGALAITGTVTVPVPPPPPVPIVLVLPQVIVEAGLVTASPVQPSTVLVLDDPVLGLLDTATLGSGVAWSSISPWVISFTVTRPSTRLAGPLWNYQPGTASIVLDNSDGRFDPDNLAGPYVTGGATQLLPMVPVRVRAIFAGTAYALYSGYADGWMPAQVTYNGGYAELTLPATDAFKVLGGITLPALGSPTGIGAATGARIRDILARAGWWTSAEYSAVGPGSSTLQGTTLGDTALNLMQVATDSEIGQLYVTGAGAVTFRGRQQILSEARSNTVQAVFGDLPGTSHPAGTELACAAIGRASDDATIANDIQATHVGGTLQEAQDAASIARYLFPRSYARSDLILQGDNDALAWAQWVLYVAKAGEDRFESLQVDPAADPANLWPQVLGREVGDRIQVWTRPAALPSPVSKDCFIAGITHQWDSVTSAWLTTWTLQDTVKYGSFLTLDNATLGQLDANALAF